MGPSFIIIKTVYGESSYWGGYGWTRKESRASVYQTRVDADKALALLRASGDRGRIQECD